MAVEYFIFIFLSSLAVIQVASVWNKLDFLLLVRNRALSFMLAIIVILASYYWFFYLARGYEQDSGGNQQLLLFPIGVLSSLIFTLFSSSPINSGRKRQRETGKEALLSNEGLETLREMTYWQALRKLFKKA